MRGERIVRNALIIVMSACSLAAGQIGPQIEPAPLEEGKLYLNVGTVDTAALPNLLNQGLTNFDPAKPVVLQLDGPITPERRTTLEDLGVHLGDYLPQHAYTADVAGVQPAALAAVPFVRWVGAYANLWKLDPELGNRPHLTPERQAMADRGEIPIVITLFPGRANTEALQAVKAIQGAVVHYTDHIGENAVISATVPLASVANLAFLDSVEYVEEAPELTFRNSTDRWIVQSNINNVTPLYDNGIHGEGQIVGILDGRPDQNHCSLNGGKIIAYNSSPGGDFHGTHVSGTAVGDGGSFNNTRGVAYLANMVFNTVPSFNETAIIARLDLHHSQGARVHTNSWGNDGTTNYDSLCRGFDSFIFSNEDDLVCLAVTNLGSLKNPENAKNLLAVGASQDTPSQASHCSGGAGPTADGRRKPEIYAPGCSTQSSLTGSGCSTTGLTGTSMASPAVAGTGALVRQYYVDGYYPSGVATPADAFTPSGALVKATLLNSAVDMTGIGGYPSNTEGWGRVLADNALFFAGDARQLVVLDDIRNAAGLSTGMSVEYQIEVTSSSQRLEVTLVWTDPPASASTGTGFAAVNDLDLEVVSPGGTLYKGNVFSGGSSVPGGAKDDRNNVEQVQLNSPAVGTWTVRTVVAAANVNKQGFALIATGAVSASVPVVCTRGDLTDDGNVNGADINRFADILVNGGGTPVEVCAGDVEAVPDGTVDMDDLPVFVNCVLQSVCP